jgi:hypothetical protein
MKYDFIILTSQHCGSHLLATALDSHPKIRCFGELVLIKGAMKLPGDQVEEARDQGLLIGGIVHLNQRAQAKGRVEAAKVIRLERPKGRSDSGKSIPGGGKISDQAAKEFSDRILDVKYDELTGGKQVEWLPVDVSTRLCVFLEVATLQLGTWLVKGQYEKQIGIHKDWKNEHLPNPVRARPCNSE